MFDIDYNYYIIQFFSQFDEMSTFEIISILLFQYWGWVVFVLIFLRYLAYPEYMFHIQNRWAKENVTYTYLAIDVPKRNEQSVQALENFFNHLQGAHGTFTKWGKYIDGEFQLSFSCELVSIEGNVQFLIRTPSHWRNLVEAAIYAQFPDAEITEVQDYISGVPKYYPNDTHDVWGTEFTLSAEKWLPIKTYLKFEHKFSETFVDPMAALLETMSQIGQGEQIWLQILITPLEVGWAKKGRDYINKMLGIPPKAAKKGLLGQVISEFPALFSDFTEQLMGLALTSPPSEKKEEQQFRMMNLTPGQKDQVESIENKISKLAFNTKIRYVYVAEKDKMNKGVGVNAVIGAIKQWTDMNLNGLKPDLKLTGTNSPQYILINYRRNSRRNILMSAYRNRSTVTGSSAKPMCSEELASLWHFPSMYIKAPLLKRTSFTKVAAPVGLPFEEVTPPTPPKKLEEVIAEKTQVIPTFDYDSDEFEMQFAKDKESFIKSRPEREKKLAEIAKEEKARLKELQKKDLVAAKDLENKAKKVKEKTIVEAEEKQNKIPENLPFVD